ncbi:MAG TPA: condensation domain-containing protein, partial [Bryobacteraceae bacterium]
MTSIQRTMALASVRAPRRGIYEIQEVCEFEEELDGAALKAAWKQLAGCHAALRTVIDVTDGRFNQYVEDEADPAWQELDWTTLDPSEIPAKLEDFAARDAERGFDFAAGVPMRFTLITVPRSRSILIWTAHHALLDGRSYPVVWCEWFAFYHALRRGEILRLPPAPLFSDYVRRLENQDWSAAERYWCTRLAGVSQTSGYVTDRIRPAADVEREGTRREHVRLSDEISSALSETAQNAGLKVHAFVQGAWALLLSRYSGCSDIVFGETRVGRARDRAIGLYLNTLPVRVHIEPDALLIDWLEQIRRDWDALRDYEHSPLDRIREWSGFPPGMPLFEAALIYDRVPAVDILHGMGPEWERRAFTVRQRTDSALT